jgi:hypothetical protein
VAGARLRGKDDEVSFIIKSRKDASPGIEPPRAAIERL